MKSATSRDGDDKRPEQAPGRGRPATHAAHAVRKDVVVRVSVMPPSHEPEELGEHGYGHGV
jgi:hypothetical protein